MKNIFFLKEQVLRSFQKFSMQEKYDFSNILSSTNEAVRYILSQKYMPNAISLISNELHMHGSYSNLNNETNNIKILETIEES